MAKPVLIPHGLIRNPAPRDSEGGGLAPKCIGTHGKNSGFEIAHHAASVGLTVRLSDAAG